MHIIQLLLYRKLIFLLFESIIKMYSIEQYLKQIKNKGVKKSLCNRVIKPRLQNCHINNYNTEVKKKKITLVFYYIFIQTRLVNKVAMQYYFSTI